jgi:hypothetical protein
LSSNHTDTALAPGTPLVQCKRHRKTRTKRHSWRDDAVGGKQIAGRRTAAV